MLFRFQHLFALFLASTQTGCSDAAVSSDGDQGCLYCQLGLLLVEYEDETGNGTGRSEEDYRCFTEGWEGSEFYLPKDFTIDLSAAFVEDNQDSIASGSTFACVEGGEIDYLEGAVVVPQLAGGAEGSSNIHILHEDDVRERFRGRSLQTSPLNRIGNRSLLVVRLTGGNVPPYGTEKGLAAAWFGQGPEAAAFPNNCKAQYQRCSANKLNFVPASHDLVEDGVLNLNIPFPLIGELTGQIMSAITIQLNFALGVDAEATFDHIVFCMPEKTMSRKGDFNWVAFAYVNGVRSYYNGGWCDSLSAQMHEVNQVSNDMLPNSTLSVLSTSNQF